MTAISTWAIRGLYALDEAGRWVGLLGIRLLLAYEFGIAGLEKLRGVNWFADIRGDFPFPFSVVPADISWFLATWTELLGAAALVVGLGTRFWAFTLMVLAIVAWVAVHGVPMPSFSLLLSNPDMYFHYALLALNKGYNVCDNGFKLPLMYLMILVPLVLSGPGRASLDHWLRQVVSRK